MLYPLSYEGASAQSSDPGFTWGGREWPAFTRVTRTPVRPAQERTPSTRTPGCDRRSAPVTRVGTGSPVLASAGEHTPRTSSKIMWAALS